MSIPNVSATLRKTSTGKRAGSGSMFDTATKIMTTMKVCYREPSLRCFTVCVKCVCVHQVVLSVVDAWMYHPTIYYLLPIFNGTIIVCVPTSCSGNVCTR